MKSLLESLKTFNATWNDIPRRLLLIIAMFGCLFLILLVFPYIAPFAFAALLAWVIEPVIKFFLKRLGNRRSVRGLISALLVLFLISLISIITLYLFNIIFREIKSLMVVLPGFVGGLTQDALAWIQGINWDFDPLHFGFNIEDTLIRMLGEASTMITTLASRIATGAARIMLQAFSSLPYGILFIVMIVFGTFYMSADKDVILSFFKRLLPEKFVARSVIVRSDFFLAIFSQIRAAIIIFIVTFAILAFGFVVIGVDYAILFALLIAFIDMLPVLGAGMFLFPMIIYGFATSNYLLGFGSAFLYIMVVIVRQFLQPKIVGKQLGMHPLLTMIAMYVGLKAMGVLGMILAPLMLTLCKTVLPDGKGDVLAVEEKIILKKVKQRKQK